MSDNSYDHLIKILLIGESGVGKTCILQRFNRGDFLVNHLTTIAIDFKMKIYEVKNKKLKMQIWDTAGQERFNTLTKGFFKSAHGIMIVYSITDEKSFQQIGKWMNQIKENAPPDVKILLVGNKSDLKQERVVSYEAGEDCAQRNNVPFFETSAFNGENINKVFEQLGSDILETLDTTEKYDPLGLPSKKKKKCC